MRDLRSSFSASAMIFLSTLLGSAAPMGCGQGVFSLHEAAQPEAVDAVIPRAKQGRETPAPEAENKSESQPSNAKPKKYESFREWIDSQRSLKAKYAAAPAAGLDLG